MSFEILSQLLTIANYLFWYLLLPYMFYQRVICMYIAYFYYVKQRNRIYRPIGAPYPILCDIPYFLKYLSNNENKHASVKWGDVEVGEFFNKNCVAFYNYEPWIDICDVDVVEQLYTTHNALFDKHPLIQNLTLNLTGHSILFDESS